MEFLKEVFGNKPLTYDEFVTAINAHNGNEANKDKQIKIGNLGTGEYVGKGKFDAEIEKLNSLLSGKTTELETANGLIKQLKESAKGNEDMQGKIAQYETTVADLQKQLVESKIKAALKFNLLSEKALDVPYVTYKIMETLKEQGKQLELDDNDNIKGWDAIISDTKTQLPNQFASAKQVQVNSVQLPQDVDNKSGVTQEQFNKMGYQSRLKLKQESPDVYAQMTGKQTNN